MRDFWQNMEIPALVTAFITAVSPVGAAHAQTAPAIENVNIFGNHYQVCPHQEPGTGRTWSDVGRTIADEISETSQRVYGHGNVMSALTERMYDHMHRYDQDVSNIAKDYMRNDPSIPNNEVAEMIVAEKFMAGQMEKDYPEAQLNHDQYLAYRYLTNMMPPCAPSGPVFGN